MAQLQSENEKYLDLGGKCNSIASRLIKLSLIFISNYLDEKGCSYCGGLGHRITDCPKLEAIQNKQASNIGRRDYLANTTVDY